MAYAGPKEQLKSHIDGSKSKLDDPNFSSATYESRCLPVVSKSSIIVAICGPNDYKDQSSPKVYDWFHSDFYLMYHLLKGTAATQYWLTCLKPEEYVRKYKELLHVSSDGTRRAVLDASMLSEMSGITTIPDKELASSFLEHVADASKQTKDTNRQILVMMFGHGWEGVYSIIIGGVGAQGRLREEAISPKKLRQALKRHNNNPQATTFSTSGYGGGWCYSRCGNTSDIPHDGETVSLPVSQSIGHLSGSMHARSIAEALIRAKVIGESESDPRSTSSFTTFTKAIHDILVNEVDYRSEPDKPSFAAQDDLWGADARYKSGFPLSTFKERYESFRLVHEEPRECNVESASLTGSLSSSLLDMDTTLETPEDRDWSTMCAPLRLPPGPAKSRLMMLAWQYVKCTSIDEARVSNILGVYNISREFLEGKELPWFHLKLIAKALHYRMYSIIGQANNFKRAIGAPLDDFPWCHEIDVYEKQNQLSEERSARYDTILALINKKGVALFDSPGEGAGLPFTRGTRYLALALVHTNWSMEIIEQSLVSLARRKAATSEVENTISFLKLDRRDTIKRHLEEISTSYKNRLRDSSPVNLVRSESQRSDDNF